MLSDDQIKARVVAGMWVDRWTGTRAVTREEVALAYASAEDVDRVIEVIETAAEEPDCPVRTDFEGAAYWPPHWSLVEDPDLVRDWIRLHDPDAVPWDLRE